MPSWLISILVPLAALLGVMGTYYATRQRNYQDAQSQLATNAMQFADRKDIEIARLGKETNEQAIRITSLEKANRDKDGEIDRLGQRLGLEQQAKNQQQIEINWLKQMMQTMYETNVRLETQIHVLEKQIARLGGSVKSSPIMGVAAMPVFPMAPQGFSTSGEDSEQASVMQVDTDEEEEGEDAPPKPKRKKRGPSHTEEAPDDPQGS